MAKVLFENALRFIVLILAQVFLLKNVGYYNLAAPFPYIMFILLLPIRISNVLLFLLAVICGLAVDAFYDTMGLHTAACVVLAWVRVIFLNITLQAEDHEAMATPGISEMSFRWFFIYVFVLTFIHHFVLFLLEIFSFSHFFSTLLSVLFSCIFTSIIILLIDFVFYKQKRR